MRAEVHTLITAPEPVRLDQMFPSETPARDKDQTFRIRTRLRLDCFEAALRRAVAETVPPSRYWRFGPRPVSETDVDAFLEYHDFSSYSVPEAASEFWLENWSDPTLTAAHLPLFRFALAKLREDEFIWVQTWNDRLIDTTARRRFAARVVALYDAMRDRGRRPF